MGIEKQVKIGLKKYFNYDSFREGQEEIICDVLRGKDVLGVLPTGSGKSLCYQLPSLLMDGTTIVISPLISLMIDQVKELKSRHIKQVVSLNSFNHYEERQSILEHLTSYKLVFMSPELFQKPSIRQYLKKIKINFIVIDEAHCISQWGYEFRPDYLKIKDVIKDLGNPPLLALSATVTPNVQEDIIHSLARKDIIKHIYPMDRENISLVVEKLNTDEEKINFIGEMIQTYHVPTLIYFSSRKVAEDVAFKLSKMVGNRRIAYYHGGLEQRDRLHIQQQFMNEQLDVICCTSAFGMGINKEDIRMIIHYHMPSQIESFIQEIGRAGRDGNNSLSILLHAENDKYLPQSFIENELPTEDQILFVLERLAYWYEQGCNLPDERDLYELFNLNETQWRFIHSQLEKHGMIRENNIIYNQEKWQAAFINVNHFRDMRWQVKQDKLNEMLKWINEVNCLRKSLYLKFQSHYKEPTGACCSNCDFSYSKFQPKEMQDTERLSTSWEERLKRIFYVGENE